MRGACVAVVEATALLGGSKEINYLKTLDSNTLDGCCHLYRSWRRLHDTFTGGKGSILLCLREGSSLSMSEERN